MPPPRITVNLEVLRECMDDEELSQNELARQIDVHKSTISRLMVGERDGSAPLIEALKARFPARADELIVRSSEVHVTTTMRTGSE